MNPEILIVENKRKWILGSLFLVLMLSKIMM